METGTKCLMIHPTVNPLALKTAMGYRGFTQSKLSKEVEGLSQPNLSKFLNGNIHYLSISVLKDIMCYLNFPFDFLYKDIKPVKYFL